jgi:hypothetical protein
MKLQNRSGSCDWLRLLPVVILIGSILPARAQTQPDAPPLASLLERLGNKVELFRQQFPGVTCTESLLQVKLGKSGEIIRKQDSQSDYLILMKLRENYLTVEESRIVTKQPKKQEGVPLLVTGGFSTLVLVFHPLYQNCFEFVKLPEEMLNGKRVLRIRFRHVAGTRSTAAVRLETRDVPLDLKGHAWIDPETATVLRITAELAEPLSDLGLQTFSADVQYAPIRFATSEGDYWLPASAAIEVATARQHWRNVHQFTNYRRFSVTSASSVQR